MCAVSCREYDSLSPPKAEVFAAAHALLARALPAEERRTQAGQAALLQNPLYHLTLRQEGEDVSALLAYWVLPGFWYVEHLAVDESLRGRGIGGEMVAALLGRAGQPVVLEVEPPHTAIAARRIAFYERLGFHVNPYDYRQPPLQPGFAPCPLLLLTHPGPVGKEGFARIRGTLYREVYGVQPGEGQG